MGVQDLWPILEPVRESVPLYSLSGKTLAVDLSLWVCEAQHVQAMMGRVTKPHLRNLFFRVSSLTLMGIKPVFVMEGEAPKIKAETMSKRTETRFGGFKKKFESKVASNTTRGRFNAVLRECAEMLDYMGVPWVKAAGEAEAMCAYLDSQGLVDGCITNDGDAFLYGAQTVYNNFNMSSKDPQVDCYQTCRIETELQLCRENLVGLAILLGCDYIPKGVLGVGKEHALKYIQSLKGQTLLQKISQWKKNEAEVFESVSKKVSHCRVCRHPGSAKAHERSGCVFCDSKHFCEPQDFDYQCPCDWHRQEQTRQALSLETNIRKKTLASPQFPFREIINEFLTSKDKPVSDFKRRQPNMLLMQKFAYDKMEWPRHYTSEKVLVLITYTELKNRKHGKESTSQIRPIRILKPRVRNAVSCFEVIWSKPEHYVFPEDHPAEDQHEVRTVEEETLFSVAFPEVVEHYLREKALAEENKLKKKKPKRKKEQPTDVCDGITDLLAQMNLQTLPNATVQKQISPPADSCTEKTDVLFVDTPVNHRQRINSNADRGGLDDLPTTPLFNPDSETTTSPSVSAVIEALHLSDIDWNAMSFTSSPAPQVSKNDNSESRPQLSNDHYVTQTKCEDTELDVRPANTRPAAEQSLTESSLRDRVLMKNAAKSINQHTHSGVVPMEGRCELDSLEEHSLCNYTSQPSSLKFTRSGSDVKATGKDSGINSDKSQCFLMKSDTQAKNQQVNGMPSKKPPQKYKFVKTTSASSSSSSSALKQRCNSCPCPGDKYRKMPQTSKKSVCLSVCSSSEDSDGENQQVALQRKNKIKPFKKFTTDMSLKSASRSNPREHTVESNECHQPFRFKSHRPSVDVNTTPVSTKSRGGEDVTTVVVDCDSVFSPASSLTVLDSDDSVVGSDSPLPLAERLRLKFIK